MEQRRACSGMVVINSRCLCIVVLQAAAARWYEWSVNLLSLQGVERKIKGSNCRQMHVGSLLHSSARAFVAVNMSIYEGHTGVVGGDLNFSHPWHVHQRRT